MPPRAPPCSVTPFRVLLACNALVLVLLVVRPAPPAAICPPPVAPSPLPSPSPPPPPTRFTFPPAIKRVIINVGANVDPPVSKEDDIAVIAVEPMLHTAWAIPKHERTYVVTAAISDSIGFANFFVYNGKGMSSSLTEMKEDASKPSGWAGDDFREKGYPPMAFVPVLTLRQLLDAVPPTIDIILLKTDMQGYDFVAVSAAGSALRRVKQLFSEVNCKGFAYNPAAPDNSFERKWDEYMKGIGFVLDTNAEMHCPDHPVEGNALWTRDDARNPGGKWWD